MNATTSVARPRYDVPRFVVYLLWPIYRRSESRSAWDTGTVYVLRGVGSRHGPVLRTGCPHRGEYAAPPS